jgi:hypothetical protein
LLLELLRITAGGVACCRLVLQSRLIEVIQDLLGPVRRQPGHPWEPTLCGLSKWELLREEVLPLMAGKPKLESNRRLVSALLLLGSWLQYCCWCRQSCCCRSGCCS